jgi:tRNA dimethylallyltransferase
LKTFSLSRGSALQTELVAIVGPTAVGKTEIAIQIAERITAEIVSADSRLFYRGMDIGTAKPTLADRQRVPHYLIDIIDPDQDFSIATYQEEACKAIGQISSHGHLPLLVGGTGQYIRAVIESWDVPAVQPNKKLRSALEQWAEEVGREGLHARLAILDPQAATAIDWRNLRRTIRALEVIFSSGVRFSAQKRRSPNNDRILQIGLIRPRAELYQRIDERINAILEAGFLAEVQSLLNQGYSPDLPAFSAIGYREMAAVLQGSLSIDEAVAMMKRKTRIFVRRQANWFKLKDPRITWFSVTQDIVDKVVAVIQSWTSGKAGEV